MNPLRDLRIEKSSLLFLKPFTTIGIKHKNEIAIPKIIPVGPIIKNSDKAKTAKTIFWIIKYCAYFLYNLPPNKLAIPKSKIIDEIKISPVEHADEVLKIALTKDLKRTEWVEVDLTKKDDKSQASIQ